MKLASRILILFCALLTWGCSQEEPRNLPGPPPGFLQEKANLLRGEGLFAAHCAECHGTLAEGRTQRAARFNPPAPDFRERHYRRVKPGYLYRRIEQGRLLEPFRSRGSVMPPWGPYLTKDEIWSLVAYLLSRSAEVEVK